VVYKLSRVVDRHQQGLMHIAARAIVASYRTNNFKIVGGMLECGFPTSQVDDIGIDAFGVFCHPLRTDNQKDV
jgi:hypothetical protein